MRFSIWMKLSCCGLLWATSPAFAQSHRVLPINSQALHAWFAAPVAQTATHIHSREFNGWRSLDISIDGVIEFTDDDRDVKSLSPDGHFRVEEGTWFGGRSYEVKADAAGNLTKTYSLGWSAKALDSDGRAWLARMLPEVIRNSAAGAPQRIARLLHQGGPQAVLSEVGVIRNDAAKRIYLEELFSETSLTDEQLKEAARLIRKISSDGEKAQVILFVEAKYFNDDLRWQLFDAVASISSDGDKRRVLSDIAEKDGDRPETAISIARTARSISSDGDKAAVLMDIADQYRTNDELRGAYFAAVNSISSDGDHARVLSKLLSENVQDSETLDAVLKSAERISSDGDKANVLTRAIPRYMDDEPIRIAFFDTANSISSDGDHRAVISALLQRSGLAAATLADIATSARRISSDGDKARVLIELAGDNIDPIREPFFAATNSISSDGDRRRVLQTVLDKSGTSDAIAITAIESAARLSSDGDKSSVLLDAVDRYSSHLEVNTALRKALEGMTSDVDYRRVMTALNSHSASR